MPESVSVDKSLQIIIVHSFSAVSFEQMTESISAVQKIHRETGIDKVLVNAGKIASIPSISEMFELAKEFPRSIRIAVLLSENQMLREGMQFGQTVAHNRGINIRLFELKSDAIEWLNK